MHIEARKSRPRGVGREFLLAFQRALEDAHAKAVADGNPWRTGHGLVSLDTMATWECNELFVKPISSGRECAMPAEHSGGCDCCSFSQCSVFSWTGQHLRPATIFVSHSWRFPVVQVLRMLIDYAGRHPSAVFWFDLFQNDQNRTDKPHEWWATRFQKMVSAIGHTLLLLSPWDAPIPLTRAWCLWEIGMTIESNGRLEILLDAREAESLKRAIVDDQDAVTTMLSSVDARKAEAALEQDKRRIFGVIDARFGFDRLNQMVKKELRRWACATARSIVEVEQASTSPVQEKIALYHAVSRLMCLLDQDPFAALHLSREALAQATETGQQMQMALSHRSVGRALCSVWHARKSTNAAAAQQVCVWQIRREVEIHIDAQ